MTKKYKLSDVRQLRADGMKVRSADLRKRADHLRKLIANNNPSTGGFVDQSMYDLWISNLELIESVSK